MRWVAWSIVAKKYIVNAYRIVENDLSLIVNFYSLRRTLVEFYIKAAIFYAINSEHLPKWLEQVRLKQQQQQQNMDDWVDVDTCFNTNLDSDYDAQLKGVTLKRFSKFYFKWICMCKNERINNETSVNDDLLQMLKDNTYGSTLVKFCFLISVACRRALNTACCSNNTNNNNNINMNIGTSMSQTIRNAINANMSLNSAPLTMTSIGINNSNGNF